MVESISNPSANVAASNVRLKNTTTSELSSALPAEKEPLSLIDSAPSVVAISPNTGVASPAVTLLVSKESQERASQDLAIAKLVRKANAVKEPYNQEKVDYFKQLIKNPQALTQYLTNVETNSIATDILNAPEGSILT
jgi:hypothetical protein